MSLADPKPCPHAVLAEVVSEGGGLLAFQCSACLRTWSACMECNTPMDSNHLTHRTGCTKCGQGDFCNVRKPICDGCAPAQDGVCKNCRHFFSQTGRQQRAGKLYCNDTCKGRELRKNAKGRALVAEPEAEATP